MKKLLDVRKSREGYQTSRQQTKNTREEELMTINTKFIVV